MTDTRPDADQIERIRVEHENSLEDRTSHCSDVEPHEWKEAFDKAHDRCESLLRALDSAKAELCGCGHAHYCKSEVNELQAECDALRAEVEWYRRAINDALGDLESGHAMQSKDTLIAALNPQPEQSLAQAAREHIEEMTRQLTSDNAFGDMPESDPQPDAEEDES